ncbi:MAG: aminotransferase class III-fold pyridoxal phosphate-dependent enzyme, partial [Pseudomonadota bacterium]|nr:aminotransferase class III-fold pyridoxal phosphate-dependent enzyme [Pseudomonadota bacterium]
MQTHDDNGINPVMGTYNRSPLSFVRGDGAWLETETGDKYLDFTTGIAVNSLGHGHPKLVAVLKAQAEKLWHVSNLYTVPEQQALAATLTELTFAEKIFFCNSGAEAIEGSIKTARKYFADKGDDSRYEIICFAGAFHGRTLAALAATGNESYLNGFGPPLAGFKHVDSFDIELVKAAITPAT